VNDYIILPRYPKLINELDIIPMLNASIQFRGTGRPVLLTGFLTLDLIPQLTKLLDGNHTVPEIVQELDEFEEKEILECLRLLYLKGLIEDEDKEAKKQFSVEELDYYKDQIRFLSRFVGATRASDCRYRIQLALKESRVLVLESGYLGKRLLEDLCVSGIGCICAVALDENRHTSALYKKIAALNPYISFEIATKGLPRSQQDCEKVIAKTKPNLVVVATHRMVPQLYDWVNKACITQKTNWTRVCLEESLGILGPSVVPFQTACYTCYDTRSKANSPQYIEDIFYEEYLKHSKEIKQRTEFRPWSQAVASLCTIEIIKLLTYLAMPATYNRVFSIDFLTGESGFARVLKLPRCPDCSLTVKIPKRLDFENLLQ
jgi:bacteriocin biosynthesis cyclodehydratase domain-containing protein